MSQNSISAGMMLRMPAVHPIPLDFRCPERQALMADVRSLLSQRIAPRSPKKSAQELGNPGSPNHYPSPTSSKRSPGSSSFADLQVKSSALERHGAANKGSLSWDRSVQELKSLCALGILCENRQDFAGALAAYRKMLTVAERTQEVMVSVVSASMFLNPETSQPIDGILVALNQLTSICLRMGLVDDALEYARSYRAKCPSDHSHIADTNLALCYLDAADYPQAYEYATQALQAATDIRDPMLLWTCAGNAGLVRYLEGRPLDAEVHFIRTLEQARMMHRRDLEAYSLYLVAHAAREAGHYDHAMLSFQDAIQLARYLENRELANAATIGFGIAKGSRELAQLCAGSR